MLSQLFQILLQVFGSVCKNNVIESGYTPGQILILFWTFLAETEPWTKKKMAFYNLWWKFVWAIIYTTASLESSRKITRILTALFWLTNKHQFKMIICNGRHNIGNGVSNCSGNQPMEFNFHSLIKTIAIAGFEFLPRQTDIQYCRK